MVRTLWMGTLGLWFLVVNTAPAQVVVVDNTDPGFAVLAESWSTTSATGQYGADYRFRSTTFDPGLVEWRPTLPNPGQYRVDVWYRSSVDRPRDARYTVFHANGVDDVFIDQRGGGSQWVELGVFNFDRMPTERVTLSSGAEAGKSIVADAVRLTRLSDSGAVGELRACWLSHYTYLNRTEGQLRQMARNMRAGGINTVYIAAYAGQTVWWPSKAYNAAGGSWGSNSVDYCDYLIDIFRDEGLKVGAWFEYGLALGFNGHPIGNAHPEWLARDSSGDPVTGENGGFIFLSPGHPEVRQLMVDMVRELAENYSFDDIQIDRFRWARKDTGREYGYEQVTRDLYFQTYGVFPPNNVNNNQWVQFRIGLVNDTVRACYEAIKAANPLIVVSSAPTGYYGLNQHMQHWHNWVNDGYLDVSMPQMYRTSLSSFRTEFDLQRALVPNNEHKLAVGYRAQEDNDWTLVADQMDYARSFGVNHGTLWVYHQYTSQIAIQDEIDNLPQPGQPWAAPAFNPFVDERNLQVIVDDSDGSPAYQEFGSWGPLASDATFRFAGRLAAVGTGASADFAAAIPTTGKYEVSVWYASDANRTDAAQYTVHAASGDTDFVVDQRSDGDGWVALGRLSFAAGDIANRLTVTDAPGAAGLVFSADAVKLRLDGFALGDANGDERVDGSDWSAQQACVMSGPLGSVDAACEVFDFNDDNDFDTADFAAFQARFNTN